MEVNDRIAENTGLIYVRLKAFGLTQDQDAESLAYEALYKAAKTFNDKAGTLFSTYAVCCINNAICRHIRTLNRKRQLEVVSYDAPAGADNDTPLSDTIIGTISLEQYVESKEACRNIMRAVRAEYALLSKRDKKIIRILYTSSGKVTQQDIAKAVNLTQVSVSRVISAFKHKVRQRLEIQMKEVASIIKSIGATSGTNDKLALLRVHAKTPGLKEILRFIYNPYCKTGISDAKLAKSGNMFNAEYVRPIGWGEAIQYFTTHQTGSDSDLMFAKAFISYTNKAYGVDAMRLACAIVTQNLKIGITANLVE